MDFLDQQNSFLMLAIFLTPPNETGGEGETEGRLVVPRNGHASLKIDLGNVTCKFFKYILHIVHATRNYVFER